MVAAYPTAGSGGGATVTAEVAERTFPLVSVIMPIRNEAGFIARSLRAVLAQDYPAERLEVLIADGMSDDETREKIAALTKEHPTPPVTVLDNPAGIVPTGFNLALARARGEVIVRVDGHCEIASDYVRRCVELLREKEADNVGGLQKAVGQSLSGRAAAAAASSPFGVGNARFHYADKAGWADTVYLGAYRREVFERLGNFDEELVRNQDDEFNFRLTQAGGKIWLDPSVKCIYYCRTGLRKLWRQYFQYGFYKVQVIRKHGAVSRLRHLVPSLFILGLAVSFITAAVTGRPLWALAVAGPYAVASAAASLWAARHDPPTLPLLPVAFFVMHASYGLGFLRGLSRLPGWRRLSGGEKKRSLRGGDEV